MTQSGRNNLIPTLVCGQDYIFDYCCDLCERDRLQKKAKGYCADCQDYLCTECFSTHLTPKRMRHHVLLDQHHMPKDQQQNRDSDTCMEVCTDHPNKMLEYVCSEHDLLGCAVCMALNHCNCQCVEFIPDIASGILNKVQYIDLQKRITALTQVTTIAIQTSQAQAKLSQICHTDALHEFQQFKKDISKAIDMIEKNLIKEADKFKKDEENKMKLLENQYKNVLKDTQSLSSKFTRLQHNGQFCQMFVAMKKAEREIDAAEATLGDAGNTIQTRDYRLIIGRELQLLLETPETMVKLEVVKNAQPCSKPTQSAELEIQNQQSKNKTTLVAVSSSKHETVVVNQTSDSPDASQHNCSENTTKQHNRDEKKTSAQHVMDMSVESMDGRITPEITGCVVLSGDKLVMVDMENNKVNLIDLTNNKVVSQLKLPGRLWDITMVSSTQVAVTSDNTHTIYIVNVSEFSFVVAKLKLDRGLKVNGECRGIASINDKFVVSYGNPVKVEIISLSGLVLQTIVTEDNGKELFTSPWYVAVSRDHQSIYISDWYRHTVTSINLTGQVQATYKSDKLRWPRGLTVDSTGTVYVCGWISNNMLQLTADLKEIQQLLQSSDGVVWPKYVYYCQVTDRLYVGLLDSDVKVYQLKNQPLCLIM